MDASTRNPWNFPVYADFLDLLHSGGFETDTAYEFMRPTQRVMSWVCVIGCIVFQIFSFMDFLVKKKKPYIVTL